MDELVALMTACQRSAETQLHYIRQEEQAIRDQVARLDAAHRKAHDLPITDALAMRSVGGDLAWRDWMLERRRELQIRLAQVLARKGVVQKELRQVFGKTLATQELRDAARNQAQKDRQAKAALDLSHMGLMRIWEGQGKDSG